jgi:hypothetical protein
MAQPEGISSKYQAGAPQLQVVTRLGCYSALLGVPSAGTVEIQNQKGGGIDVVLLLMLALPVPFSGAVARGPRLDEH